MPLKADTIGRLRAKLAVQFPTAPVNDLTTQLQRLLGQDGMTSGSVSNEPSNPLLTQPFGAHTVHDLNTDFDIYLDRLTSNPSQPTTPA